MGTDKKQAKLYYNSNNSIGKQTNAYITATEKSLLTVDTSKDNVTGTIWAEIADALGIQISELIDQNHTDFKSEYGDTPVVMDSSSWLKILDQKPHLVSSPILVMGKKVFRIKTASDIVKYIDSDSAGIKKPYN